LILLHSDEAALAKADQEQETNALGRARSMSPQALAALRAGRGSLFAELSDWLLIRQRRTARLLPGIAADPYLSKVFAGLAAGEPAGAV
jgi:hypothetical protein